ncbi:microtubule-associated protein futsch-like [Ornithodoros turicata]|uniref:microtubule-associated protein futsch-like n=1 Tax=Ornithodoros turicata TaxID=34597 RepID=UPI00313A2699
MEDRSSAGEMSVSLPSTDGNLQSDASEASVVATGGTNESGPAEIEHASVVLGVSDVSHDAVASRTLVSQSEMTLERFVAGKVSKPDRDELGMAPTFDSFEQDLKLEPVQIGGGGEQILSVKTVGIDDLKGDPVGNSARSLHVYPAYETHRSGPDAELGYANPFAVVEDKIAMANKELNKISRGTGGQDECSDSDVQRTSRSPRRPKKHKDQSSEQRRKDKASAQVLNIVEDAVDTLMEEFQLGDGSDIETEYPPIEYDPPHPRRKVVRKSMEDLDKVDTICGILESLTGDVKGDVDLSEIEPMALIDASYLDDTEKRSPKRKKRSKKAKSNSLEPVRITPKKKRSSKKEKSGTTRRNGRDDVGREEATRMETSEGNEGDESKDKKVHFVTSLVFRRKNMPSEVTVSATKDGREVSVVKKAVSSKGEKKAVARKWKGDKYSDHLETGGIVTSKDDARESRGESAGSRSSRVSRGSRDSLESRTSAGSTGSANSKGTRKLRQAEQTSQAKKKANAKKQERRKEVMDVSEEENVTPCEEEREIKETRKEGRKKKRSIKKSDKTRKRGDDEEEDIRIKRDSGGGISLILPRTASVSIDSAGSCGRRERRFCDKCSEEAVAKERTSSLERDKERRDRSPHRGDAASYGYRQFSFEQRTTAAPRDSGYRRKDVDVAEMCGSHYDEQRGTPYGRRGTEGNHPQRLSYGQRDAEGIRSQGSWCDQREGFGLRMRDTSYDRTGSDGSLPQDMRDRRDPADVRTSDPRYRSRSPPSRRRTGHTKEVEIELYNRTKSSYDRKIGQDRPDRRDRLLSTTSPHTPPSEPPPSVPSHDWSFSKDDLRQKSPSPTKRTRQKEGVVSRATQASPLRGEHRSADILYRTRTKATSRKYKRQADTGSRTAASSPDNRTYKDDNYRRSSKARGKDSDSEARDRQYAAKCKGGEDDGYRNVSECDVRSTSPPRGYVKDSDMGISTKDADRREMDVDARTRRAQHQKDYAWGGDINLRLSQQPQHSRYEADYGGHNTPSNQKKMSHQDDDRGRRGPPRNLEEGTPEQRVETRYERRTERYGRKDYIEGQSNSPDDGARIRQPGRSTKDAEDSLRGRTPSSSALSTQGGPFKPQPSSEYAPGDTDTLGRSPSRDSWISYSERSRRRDFRRDQRKDSRQRTARTRVAVDERGRDPVSEVTSQEWVADNRKGVRGKGSPCRSPSSTQTGYTGQAGYTHAASHMESAANISRATTPLSSNVDLRQWRKLPERSSEVNVARNIAIRQKGSEPRLNRRAGQVNPTTDVKHPPPVRVGSGATLVSGGISTQAGHSRSSPTSKGKPPNVEQSSQAGAQGINVQMFPIEGLAPMIVLQRKDHDEKQTLVVKTSKTGLKGDGSSEDVTQITIHNVKKSKDKTKSSKRQEEAQKRASASSFPSQYDDAKSKIDEDSTFKASAAGPRINVWHVPPEDMQRHLESVHLTTSDSKRSRSGCRRSERSHSRKRTCHRELRRRKALKARLMAESPTAGRETIQGPVYGTGGSHCRIEPCVEMRSMERINPREAATSAFIPGGSKHDPYTSTLMRPSSQTELKRFAGAEDQFGLPTIGVDPFRRQDAGAGAPSPRGMAPSMGPGTSQPATEGVQGMPVQQTIIVPGSRGLPILTQSLGQSHIRPITLDGMNSGQTFLLQSQGGGQTILTQIHGLRMPNPQENVNPQTQQPGLTGTVEPELVGSHLPTRIMLTHGSGPPSVLPQPTPPPQSSPGPTETILIQPGLPPAEPQLLNHFQQDPKQQERITMFKRNMRYAFPSPPTSPPPMGPRFTAQTALIGSGAQSVRPHHHHRQPLTPPQWCQPTLACRGSRRPQGMRCGFMPYEPTRRSPRNAFSQPTIYRSVGTPFTSNSFMTAYDATQAPESEVLEDREAAIAMASTSAPALDLGVSASASRSCSESSASRENMYSFTVSTESPSRSECLDMWDRSKHRSIDPILPEAARYSESLSKSFRRFTNKGQTAVYFLFLIVAIAGLAGAITLYSKRRWTRQQEEPSFESGNGANMFGPWQRFDDVRSAPPNGTRFCASLQCSLEALALIKSIDRSLNPCDDFYGYVCSSQLKDKGSYASADAFAKKEVQRAVINFFKERSPGSGDIATAKQFWQSCINVDEIAHLGNVPFLSILNMTGLRGWPYVARDYQPDVADVWRKAGKIIRHMSLSPLVNVRVIPALRRDKRVIVLSRGEHILPVQRDLQKVFGRDGLTADVAKAFKVVHPSSSYIDQDSTAVVDFIFKLSSISDGEVERRDGLATVVEPFINNAFGDEDISTSNGSVYITQSSIFVDALVKLVQTTPSRTIMNYLGFSVVRHVFLFSPISAKEVLAAGKKTSAAVTRESECVRTLLNDALPKATAERVVYAAVQKNVNLPALKVLTSDLKKSAVNRISKLHWMGTRTRARVASQVREIDIRFLFENDTVSDSLTQGPPPERLPDVLPGQTLLSYQRLRAYRFKSSIAITTSAGVSNLSGSFTHEDCTYSSDNKVLLLSLSTLDVRDSPTPFSLLFQVPRFGVKVLRCLLRVFLGGNIDSQGQSQSAVTGSWASPARRRYETIRSCINKQYLRIRDHVENKTANRQDPLGALNVVDNAAVGPDKDVYDAYASALRHSGSVQDSEALEGLTWTQMFYVSYAQGVCENLRRATLYQESPNWERVNVPLGNDEQFLKVFKCGGSSAMNLEPRCGIWI